MKESTSREKVLKAIRDALVNPMAPPYVDEDFSDAIYTRPNSEYDEVTFAEALAKVGGQFVYSSSLEEFAGNFKEFLSGQVSQNLHCYEDVLQRLLNDNGIFCFNAPDEYKDCEIGISTCEFLVARLGSIMVSSRQGCGRKGFFWPPLHIVVAWKGQLVYDLRDALRAVKKKYSDSLMPSLITMITGPSRTADIEKTLVLGAHGPSRLVVFFIDQPLESSQ